MKNKTLKRFLIYLLSVAVVVTFIPSTDFTFAGDEGNKSAAVQELNNDDQSKDSEKAGSDKEAGQPDEQTNEQPASSQSDDEEKPSDDEGNKEEQAEPNDGGGSVEPSAGGESVEMKSGAKGAAKGPEGEAAEGEQPRDGEEGGTSSNIMDFIPPGTITMIHTSDDSPVTATNPARPGETVVLTLSNVAETINGLQFDMHEMTMDIPAGLEAPEHDVTGTSTVQITDYSVQPQQTYSMPNTYVIGADGKIRYTWKNPCTEERPPGSGNIVDVYDLACQAENFKYSLSFEITVGDDADSIDFGHNISFPVDRSVALTVTKSIQIPGMSSISQTQAQQMTFALYDADGNPVMKDGQPVTFTRNDMMPSGLANGEWSITGLTADEYPATFIVRETGHPDIEGYTFLTSGSNVVTEATVEIPAGQSATAELKNRYTKDVSHLKVKKAFPAGSDKNFQNLTTAEKKKISFTVKDSSGAVVGSALLSDFVNGEWDLGTLPPGEYTVVETADLEGYTRTTTYTVSTENGSSSSGSGATAPVTLETDEHHVVEFDNTYTRQNGTLKIKKFFAGATDNLSVADKNKIKFAVTAPDGTVTNYTYADFTNGVLTIDPALAGTWKVVESNTATTNYSVTTTYSVNGGTSASGTTANVAVPYQATGEVDFTNTYTELGKITLTKTVGGNYWDDFGASYDTQKERRSRIRNAQYNLYRVNADGTRTKVGNTINLSSFYSGGSYTWSNLPVGNYEIDEVMTNTNSTYGSVIANTTRTTTVTVNGGTPQTTGPVEGGNTVKTGSFSVTKGGTSTVAYQNDYNKKQGKIKLDKEVWIDGVKVTDWSTLTVAQQQAMKFKITGTDIYGKSESIEVSLYDILNHQNGIGEDGYLTIDYSNSSGYTVTESGADLPNYIRVTTRKLDNGEFGAGASIAAVKINDTTTSHTVTFKNEYTGTGRLQVDKTVTGLSAADEETVRDQIYFTIKNTSGRPIVKDSNGRYVLGAADADPVHIPLSELTAEDGILLPTGTYILTEHDGDFNTEVYTWSVENVIIDGDQQIDPRTGVTSGNANVTLGNTKHVGYTNIYTRTAIGPGGGVSVIKHVLLDGTEIDASYSGVYGRIYSTVMDNIRFKIYEGTEVNDANLIEGCPAGGYTYAQLRANPPILYVGTYTIQETNYNVDHFTHSMYFVVNGTTTRDDHVTITVTQNQHVNVNVYNGYIPLGDLEVHKIIDESGDLKAADLTPAQKQAIKFSVIGYKDTSYSEVVWPEQEEGATEPQPREFTYADMTPNTDGVMSKAFHDIPIGVYVVEETSGNIPNYNVYTVEDPAGNALEVHWNTSGDQTAVKKFTNKYTRQKGNLEVTKTFGDTPNTLSTTERRKIKFTVYDSAGNVVKEFTYAQMTNGHYTISDLETGTYTIKETNADFDYFERTTTVSVNGGDNTTYSEDNGVNAPVENDATASVHFTNDYKETGALIINKSFDDEACINKLTDAQKKAVEFTIWRVNEDGTKEVVKTITYDEILKWIQRHPDQSPAGYRMLVLPGNYIVEESNADFTGYERTTTATVNGTSATVSEDSVTVPTIVKFTEATVVFDNKYVEKGRLKVKKSVEGLTLNDEQKGAIKFTVTKENNVIAEFTYADILNQPNQEYVIENLLAGNYVVSETVTDEASVFYGKTRQTFVTVGAGGETQNSTTDVTVDSNNNTVTFRNKYGNTDQLTVQKEIGGAPTAYIEKDGSLYPVWKFNLRIANLEPSTTNDGKTDIIDYIDNKADLGLFEVVTDPGDLALIDAKDSGAAAKANKLTTDGDEPTATVTLEEDYDSGKVTFHITGVTAETATSNDLIYYLIPKDAEALETLNAREGTAQGTPSNQLKKYFSNVAEYKKLPKYDYEETNKVDYEYEKLVVKKRITNYNTTTHQLTDDYGNIVNVAEYEFVINPEEMKLSNDGYIDVTDTFSTNQSVDQESITVERCVYDFAHPENSTTSPAQEGDVTYKDLSGNKILLTLKDETCFRVTYTATLLYTAEELETGDPLNLNNMVEVEGYKDGIEPTILPSSEGGGSVYRIRLRKYETGNLDNPLKGAKFKMYLDKDAADAARESGDYSQALPGTYTTDANGVIVITEYTDAQGNKHHVTAGVTYYFVESVAPEGYEKINYTVHVTLAGEGETADYEHWIYLPNDTVGIKDTPFDTMLALGALKTFTTNGSARQLEEGEFTFQISAKDGANIPMPEQTEVSNAADGKAVFGAIAYDTEDVITRDPDTKEVTGTSKTFTYLVKEKLPDGVTSQNPTKDGITYDTHEYEVAVTVAIVNGELKVTSVTVDGEEVNPDSDKYEYHYTTIDPDTEEEEDNVKEVDLYFAGLENEYTAEGTWTPHIQKNLEGRTLEAGDFTFRIVDLDVDEDDDNYVLATGTNKADGTVEMDPETLTFTLADKGANHLQVEEVYTVHDGDGVYSYAADVPVTVTVEEKKDADNNPIYNGELNVTADPEGSLTAPIVMTNKYHASGSWHPKAEKSMDGVLKINDGDYEFELKAKNNAPMPKGSTDGKKVVACDADGKVDFGQIDFYQGKFEGDDVDHKDGNKTFEYTLKEVVPDPPIFGVTYDPKVYNIKVTTTINKNSDKLGVAVTCEPEDGWNFVESTGVFTGQFENTYGPEPAKATPGYEKTLTGEVPTEDVDFEFKLEKAAGENGDFYYVKLKGDNDELKPFTTRTETLTLGPSSQTGSGEFDEITFLAEGIYKFKITETPNTNGALNPRITYDPREYYYTVKVTGSGTALQAVGTYSYKDENNEEQTAELAKFTNKYTPSETTWQPLVEKIMDEDSEPTVVKDKIFTFRLTAEKVKEKGSYWLDASADPEEKKIIADGDTLPDVEITVPPGTDPGSVIGPKTFEMIHFTKEGEYTFTIEEVKPDPVPAGFTCAEGKATLKVTVRDKSGDLKVVDVATSKSEGATGIGFETNEEDQTIVTTTFTNKYIPKPVDQPLRAEKLLTGEPLFDAAGTLFFFDLSHEAGNTAGYTLQDPLPLRVTITGEEVQEAAAAGKKAIAEFGNITFKKAGTYQFKIIESKEDDAARLHPNVLYDTTVWYVTIVIKDIDGELVVEKAEYDNGKVVIDAHDDPDGTAAAVFTNDYTPDETTWRTYVEKIMSEDSEPTAVNDKTFTFRLTADNVKANGSYWLDGSTDPADKKIIADGDTLPDVEITVPAGTAPESVLGPEAFEIIHFTKKGEYTFTVEEVMPDPIPAGFTYAEGKAILKVTVDDMNGYLKVVNVETSTSEGATGIGFITDEEENIVTTTFTNTYIPAPVDVPLDVKKTVSGSEIPEGYSYSFNFNLTASDESSPLPENTSVTVVVPDSPVASFGKMHYTEAGTYVYTIQEEEGTDPGMTYDTEPKTVTVNVTDTDGSLVAEVDGAELNDNDAYETEITNNLGLGALKISKTVDGKGGDKKKVFSFEVTLSAEGSYPYTVYTKFGRVVESGEIESGDTIGLTHGQHAIVENLPEGTNYSVTEVDSGDYTVSCTGDTGTIEVDSIVEAAFVNTPPDNPKTGDHTPFLPLLLLAQLALAGLLFLLYRRRRTA